MARGRARLVLLLLPLAACLASPSASASASPADSCPSGSAPRGSSGECSSEEGSLLQLAREAPADSPERQPPIRTGPLIVRGGAEPNAVTCCAGTCLPNGTILTLSGGVVTQARAPNGEAVPLRRTSNSSSLAQTSSAKRSGKIASARGSWGGGWRTYAEIHSGTYQEPITYLVADFNVPEKPTPGDDDYDVTSYVFPGLMDANYAWILQPVLQWGNTACGGLRNEWSYQSYMVPGHEDCTHCSHASAALPVQVGQRLRGIMEQYPDGTWRVTSTVLDTGATSTLLIEGAPPQTVPSLTLETYYRPPADICDSYPGSPVTFTNVELKTTSGRQQPLNWQLYSGTGCDGLAEANNAGDEVTLSKGSVAPTTPPSPSPPGGVCCYHETSCDSCNPPDNWCSQSEARCLDECSGKHYCGE